MFAVIGTALLICLAGCAAVFGPEVPEPVSPGHSVLATPPYDRLIEGAPDSRLLIARGGLYIWKEGDAFTVRMSRLDRYQPYPSGPRLSGSVKVDRGFLYNLRRHETNPLDEIRFGPKEVSFLFRLKADVEGFDFSVRPAALGYCITLDFAVDDAPSAGLVHLGRSLTNPPEIPLTICCY